MGKKMETTMLSGVDRYVGLYMSHAKKASKELWVVGLRSQNPYIEVRVSKPYTGRVLLLSYPCSEGRRNSGGLYRGRGSLM